MDETLPTTFSMFLNIGFVLLATLVTIVILVPWFLIAIIPLGLYYKWVSAHWTNPLPPLDVDPATDSACATDVS
jgi:hypothetical protein